MRLSTLRTTDGTRAARVDGDTLVLLDYSDVKALLEADGLEAAATATGETVALFDADFAPLIPKPDKTICVGLNYADHIKETGRDKPEAPTYFAKYARALIGAFDDIVLPDPSVSVSVDWEAELTVVVGKTLRNASPEEALAAVAGYTIMSDISVRDWQMRTSQFLSGKTFEGMTPVGPWMVTADRLGDGSGLAIRTEVNGVTKQESNTDQLVFNTATILSDLSTIMTLDVGDIVATGTPGGVGRARKPPEFLLDGDELVTTIEGIGHCKNKIVAR